MASPRADWLIEITGGEIPADPGSQMYEGLVALRSRDGQSYQSFRDLAGGAKGAQSRRFSPSAVLKRAEQTGFARLLPPSSSQVPGQPFIPVGRLPSEMLLKVTAEHVRQAIFDVIDKGWAPPYEDSRTFDLIADDGKRFPPKVVFGRAATLSLGFLVLPSHFSGGEGTPCFKVLRAAGYDVVPKGEEAPHFPDFSFEDRTWAEGSPRLVSHLQRERARGAAQSKRAEFRRGHGRLFCERCGLDPVEQFGGPEGEACIEVHHNATAVEDMKHDHVTSLADLQCLCANCHRVAHKRMRMAM